MRILAYTLVLVPIMLILINVFSKSDSFINIGDVFIHHFSLFKKCKMQFVLFYISPMAIAFGAMLLYKINTSLCESINVVTSIIISMLFAICSIIGTKDYRTSAKASDKMSEEAAEEEEEDTTDEQSDEVDAEKRYIKIKKVAKETFVAIIVTTFTSLLLVFFCIIALAIDIFIMSPITLSIASFIIYYLLGVTILSLLLIIKRMERLFSAML